MKMAPSLPTRGTESGVAVLLGGPLCPGTLRGFRHLPPGRRRRSPGCPAVGRGAVWRGQQCGAGRGPVCRQPVQNAVWAGLWRPRGPAAWLRRVSGGPECPSQGPLRPLVRSRLCAHFGLEGAGRSSLPGRSSFPSQKLCVNLRPSYIYVGIREIRASK